MVFFMFGMNVMSGNLEKMSGGKLERTLKTATANPIISILLGAVIRVDNTFARMALHLLLLIPIVGISYEFNRLVGRHDNWMTRILTAPGQWMQNFTTNEPDDSMIEVAIAAVEAVLPEEEGADRW